jgi:hypothetical protein
VIKQRTYRRNAFSLAEVGWNLLLAFLTLYASYRFPLDLVFGVDAGLHLIHMEWSVGIAFVVNPLVTFMFAYRRGFNVMARFVRLVLPLDIVAALAVLVFARGDWLILLSLSTLVHVTIFMSIWRVQLLKRGNVIRLVLFSYWLSILVHLTACGWISIRYTTAALDPDHIYLESVYWSVTTLTTIGYGDITPNSPNEMKYAIVIMLVGFVMMGYLIGNIAGILNKSDPLRARYADALEQVTAFMQYHSLPSDLQHRIVDYFGYMWQKRAAFDEADILTALPAGIRTEVSLHLKKDVIQRVPFFREASDTFIREIANEMRPIVVTPGEHVFHSGDPAGNMYFISRGTLQVLDRAGKVLTTLKDGDFFGEMALLEGRRRMGGVRAVDYCELYELTAASFNNIVEAHPDFKIYMQDVARRRAEAVTSDYGTIR